MLARRIRPALCLAIGAAEISSAHAHGNAGDGKTAPRESRPKAEAVLAASEDVAREKSGKITPAEIADSAPQARAHRQARAADRACPRREKPGATHATAASHRPRPAGRPESGHARRCRARIGGTGRTHACPTPTARCARSKLRNVAHFPLFINKIYSHL